MSNKHFTVCVFRHNLEKLGQGNRQLERREKASFVPWKKWLGATRTAVRLRLPGLALMASLF